jgi:hypothetical protein
MKASRPLRGKILNHDGGLGAPSPDLVQQRAIEIARINGRAKHNEADWRQARLELHGGGHADSWNDGDEDWVESAADFYVGSKGHRAERVLPEDADNIVEELVVEGMDEAEHEQMLEAARAQEEQEEEPEK